MFNLQNLSILFLILESFLVIILTFILSNISSLNKTKNVYLTKSKFYNIKQIDYGFDYSIYLFLIAISFHTFNMLLYLNPLMNVPYFYHYLFVIVSMTIILSDVYKIKSEYISSMISIYKNIIYFNLFIIIFTFLFIYLPTKLEIIDLIMLFSIFFIGVSFGSFINNTGLRISDIINQNMKEYEDLTLKKEKELYFLSNKPYYSKCPECNTRLRTIDNIPIFSWLFLGGKCAHCHSPIPFVYIFSEIIFGLFFLFLMVIFNLLEIKNGLYLSLSSVFLFIVVYLNLLIKQNTTDMLVFKSLIYMSRLFGITIIGILTYNYIIK